MSTSVLVSKKLPQKLFSQPPKVDDGSQRHWFLCLLTRVYLGGHLVSQRFAKLACFNLSELENSVVTMRECSHYLINRAYWKSGNYWSPLNTQPYGHMKCGSNRSFCNYVNSYSFSFPSFSSKPSAKHISWVFNRVSKNRHCKWIWIIKATIYWTHVCCPVANPFATSQNVLLDASSETPQVICSIAVAFSLPYGYAAPNSSW